MSKISKNIKKYRTAMNLSQDAVAESLFVTRQTVSSWETGRTQPDIDTICKLAELFGVSVEEMIYGSKNITDPDEAKQKSRQNLITIFSVIASALTAVGLILIFVTYWERMPVYIKTVLAFLPMLAGQAAAIYTLIKKRSKIAWCEGASVLWSAGVIATVALIDSIYQLPTTFAECFLIDLLLILPIVHILDAVTPLLFYYGGACYLAIGEFLYNDAAHIAISVALLAAGCIYPVIHRKRADDARQPLSVWISVIAGLIVLLSDLITIRENDFAIMICITSVCLSLFVADRSRKMELPFRPLGLIGTMVTMLTMTIMNNPSAYTRTAAYDKEELIRMFIPVFLAVTVLIAILAVRFRNIIEDKLQLIFCGFTVLNILSLLAFIIFFIHKNNEFLHIASVITAFCASTSLIAKGVIKYKFPELNIGLLSAIAIIIYIILQLAEINILSAGILLVVFGSMLFAVNILLSRKIKKEEKSNA